MEVVLKTDGLSKSYKRCVLDNVSMTVNKGDIYGFVGRNGAGKTTLMRVVSGLAKKSGGSFELFGVPDTDKRIGAARRRTRAMVETATLYVDETARSNMQLQCMLLNESFDCIDELLNEVGLSPAETKKVKNYSLGMRQRLAIAVAMIGQPEFLLFDEPTNGLDPEGIYHVRTVLQRMNAERGVTILVSSHILSELSKLATCYGFIERGRLIKEISAAELEKQCAESLRVRVENAKGAAELLEGRGYKVEALTASYFDLGSVPSGEVLSVLAENGYNVLGFEYMQGDLERYFMNLIGGRAQ